MKDGKPQSQIAQLLDRHKSTIGPELARSRNTSRIATADSDQAVECLKDQWSPVQIANQVGISHETIYRHVYADKAAGSSLDQQLRCQKKDKKRYASGRDRRGQIVGRRPISERPTQIEARSLCQLATRLK